MPTEVLRQAPIATGKQWLTLAPAAKRLGVHPDTLRRYADRKYIACTRTPGGYRKFLISDIDAFIC